MTTKELVWREVSIQRPYEMETLFNILTHIAALTSRGPVVWEARCRAGRMRYLVGTPKWSVNRVQEVFKAHANTQFTENVQREPVKEARKVKISKPVLSLNTEVSAAMIRAVLAAMTGAKSDAECVVQIVLGAAFAPSTTPKNLPDPNATWLQAMLGSVHNASPEQRKAVREKAEQYTYDAVIRIGISGDHTTTRLHNIISALRTLESAGVHIRTDKEQPEHLNTASLPWMMPLRLSVKELACFLLLPAGEEELPGTPGLHPKLLLPPKWYREPRFASEKRHFATTLDTEPRSLSIAPKDALEHTILLGPTGSGKSTAMQHLILSDIRAGRSVLVLDPKADLVTDLLERIPEERKDDVVVIDPSDPSPVGFNPLMYNKDPSLTADAILAVFQELFAQNWGIRSADVLGGALLTLAQIKGANLLWLPQLLTDEHFRRNIVSQVKDPIALEPFWRHYDAMRDSERRTEIAPVLNKLRQITYRPGLRNVLGQSEPKFSLADLFLKRRIVLVPLNRGLIGAESARLLGSLIVGPNLDARPLTGQRRAGKAAYGFGLCGRAAGLLISAHLFLGRIGTGQRAGRNADIPEKNDPAEIPAETPDVVPETTSDNQLGTEATEGAEGAVMPEVGRENEMTPADTPEESEESADSGNDAIGNSAWKNGAPPTPPRTAVYMRVGNASQISKPEPEEASE